MNSDGHIFLSDPLHDSTPFLFDVVLGFVLWLVLCRRFPGTRRRDFSSLSRYFVDFLLFCRSFGSFAERNNICCSTYFLRPHYDTSLNSDLIKEHRLFCFKFRQKGATCHCLFAWYSVRLWGSFVTCLMFRKRGRKGQWGR